jgi:UDP-N-acetylglucosamine--N-acetylmuramyl-(pentapeptide) pyrophosphoryl-undecaprenol N-acetylglucosamine transferase
MRVIIAAAGTAGHINPGLAIANKIKAEEKESEIIFIGTTRGLENDLVPRAGYELKTIDAYGMSKEISIDNLKKMYKTYKGIGEAKKIVKEFKPDIIIGTGGYICGAVALAAKANNVPYIIHESNAFPGKATKMLAKNAEAILVSFEEASERIPKAKKIVCTGTPVKIQPKEYSINDKLQIVKKIGLSETKPIVLIFGGSQGAKKINEAMLNIIKNKMNEKYQIIWATGPKQYDGIKGELEKENININHIENVKIMPYIYNMEEVMNIADVAVTRSGAMTITEISNLGKPSILIPLPNVSADHQLYNAKVLEKIGAAKILLNDSLDANILNKTIEEIVLNKDEAQKMGERAKTKSVYNAEERIYNEIKRVLQK